MFFRVTEVGQHQAVTIDNARRWFDADRPPMIPGRAGEGERDFRLSGSLYRWVMRWGPKRLSRDITLVHRRLLESGHAVWLGETFPDRVPPPLRDLERALARVRALFAGSHIHP